MLITSFIIFKIINKHLLNKNMSENKFSSSILAEATISLFNYFSNQFKKTEIQV